MSSMRISSVEWVILIPVIYLFFFIMGPEGRFLNWIKSHFWVRIFEVFHGHLIIWNQAVQVIQLTLIPKIIRKKINTFFKKKAKLLLLNSFHGLCLEIRDLRLNLNFLFINQFGIVIDWVWNFQRFVRFLETVDHSSDGYSLLVKGPIDFWWIFRGSK